MAAETYNFSRDRINNRKNWPFRFAKWIGVTGYRIRSTCFPEFHEDVKPHKDENAAYLYTSLHKSLWETTGIIAALIMKQLPIPYAGMGDNLVRGRFYQKQAEKVGVFLVKRATSRREVLESAKRLKDIIMNYMAHGEDVLLFPEGTRKSVLSQGTYGKFFPTVFESLLEYERNKKEILEQFPHLKPINVHIVPTNVDYSKIREDWEMLADYKGNPRTLKVWDSLKMIKHIRDTYISFGKPIKVADHLEMNRKELAEFTRDRCLELVRILPVNVVAQSILDSSDGKRIDLTQINTNISAVLRKLEGAADCFRGFTLNDSPTEIRRKVTRYERTFKDKYIDIKHREFYRLYANYISHYLKS